MDGILIAGFGTTHRDGWERTYGAFLRDVREKWPGVPVWEAVTSGIIRRKLAQRGEETRDVPSALREMAGEGRTKILVLPTFVIAGVEYHRLLEDCREAAASFAALTVAPPLLDCPAGLERAAKAVLDRQGPLPEDAALVLLGHGTGHRGDFAYPALESAFRELGEERALVGTVEGSLGLAGVRRRLKKLRPKRVILRPFLFVAGDHAKNDMAGEGEGSWKTALASDGFRVECVLEGLGEIPAIREMILDINGREAYNNSTGQGCPV